MAEVFFFLAAIGALAGALGTVALRNPFYSVLALVVHLLSLAALFLLLRAEFVAAAQVIVYVGAVMVLYLFVVAYVGGADDPIRPAGSPGLRRVSALFALVLFAELSIAILGTGLTAFGEEGGEWFPAFGTPEEIGRLLLTDFLLAFEVACPFDAITMGHDYELSDYNRSNLIFTKEMLLAEPLERAPLRTAGE